jgi:transketolase
VAAAEDAEVSIFASGSEVGIAMEARKALDGKGIRARVVSVPSFERVAAQDGSYRKEVLVPPPAASGIERRSGRAGTPSSAARHLRREVGFGAAGLTKSSTSISA